MAPAFPQSPYAVLHLGASNPHKMWLPERWRALADAQSAAGLTVVWSGGPNETGLAAAADPEGRYVNLAGRYEMAGLGHLLAGAALLVSPDTGVVHLARLTGTPAVVLFGPGSPVVSGPGRFWKDSPFAVVWEENIACRDQSLLFERPLPWVRHSWRSVADCGQPRCMWQIDNQKVMQAIEKVTGIMLARERA